MTGILIGIGALALAVVAAAVLSEHDWQKFGEALGIIDPEDRK